MLTDFDLNNVRSKGYSFFMESIFNLDNHSIKIHQIPIYFKNRTQGKSKNSKAGNFKNCIKKIYF